MKDTKIVSLLEQVVFGEARKVGSRASKHEIGTHIVVEPLERGQVFTSPDEAINHIIVHRIFAKDWDFSKKFGNTIDDRRKIDAAIKAKNKDAFVANKTAGRKWVIALREEVSESVEHLSESTLPPLENVVKDLLKLLKPSGVLATSILVHLDDLAKSVRAHNFAIMSTNRQFVKARTALVLLDGKFYINEPLTDKEKIRVSADQLVQHMDKYVATDAEEVSRYQHKLSLAEREVRILTKGPASDTPLAKVIDDLLKFLKPHARLVPEAIRYLNDTIKDMDRNRNLKLVTNSKQMKNLMLSIFSIDDANFPSFMSDSEIKSLGMMIDRLFQHLEEYLSVRLVDNLRMSDNMKYLKTTLQILRDK